MCYHPIKPCSRGRWGERDRKWYTEQCGSVLDWTVLWHNHLWQLKSRFGTWGLVVMKKCWVVLFDEGLVYSQKHALIWKRCYKPLKIKSDCTDRNCAIWVWDLMGHLLFWSSSSMTHTNTQAHTFAWYALMYNFQASSWQAFSLVWCVCTAQSALPQ